MFLYVKWADEIGVYVFRIKRIDKKNHSNQLQDNSDINIPTITYLVHIHFIIH